jgi:hypothetical protein
MASAPGGRRAGPVQVSANAVKQRVSGPAARHINTNRGDSAAVPGASPPARRRPAARGTKCPAFAAEKKFHCGPRQSVRLAKQASQSGYSGRYPITRWIFDVPEELKGDTDRISGNIARKEKK